LFDKKFLARSLSRAQSREAPLSAPSIEKVSGEKFILCEVCPEIIKKIHYQLKTALRIEAENLFFFAFSAMKKVCKRKPDPQGNAKNIEN